MYCLWITSRVLLRHAIGAPPTRASRACVRESALRVVDAGEPGIPARVTAVIYQGGHFRVEATATAAPGEMLHLVVGEPCRIRNGDDVLVAIADGWVIPAPGAPSRDGKIER